MDSRSVLSTSSAEGRDGVVGREVEFVVVVLEAGDAGVGLGEARLDLGRAWRSRSGVLGVREAREAWWVGGVVVGDSWWVGVVVVVVVIEDIVGEGVWSRAA